ncbi:MAG: ATP synthase F1 subunit delta [Fidelibacterota bacterium]
MKIERKAKHYTTVLMTVSREMDTVTEVFNSLLLLKNLVKKEATFRVFFYSHRLGSNQRMAILNTILGEACHPLVRTLFCILAEKREQNLLTDIVRQFEVMRSTELQILKAVAFSATPLSEEEFNSIRRSLLTGGRKKTVEFTAKVNPDLLGGLKLRIGNLFIDGSIKGKLQSLKRELTIKQ